MAMSSLKHFLKPHLGQTTLKIIKKDLSTSSVRMLQIDNVLVLGSGLMGSGIAQCSAMNTKFKSVVLHDVKQEQLDKAKQRIVKDLNRIKQKKTDLNVNEIVSRVTFSTVPTPGSTQNLLIVEAVPELLPLKQELFKDMYQKYGKSKEKTAILATNTSSLCCAEIGVHVENKEQFAGLHFFNPVPRMKLVEIARVDETSQETVDALIQYVKDIDHVPVVCKDTPGFIVNRLLLPYMQGAVEMLERGDASARDIDTAMKLGAGYPMGPFELMDYTGLDTNLFVAKAWQARNDPTLGVKVLKTMEKLVAEGRLGKKVGKGFYDYN